MSLSFVSSAVLKSTDGVSHNEETSVESKEVKQLRLRNEHRPLFEQLRANSEKEQEKLDEESKLMRMGMRPLDEEDCAHLERVRDLKEEREHEIQESIESELILFRAARAERQLELENLATDEKNDELKIASEPQHKKSAHVSDDTSKVAEAPTIFPKIMIKKKKRQQIRNSSESDVPSKQQKTSPKSTSSEASFSSENKQRDEKESVENKSKKESDESQKKASNSVLCGLFDGYGSESDSE